MPVGATEATEATEAPGTTGAAAGWFRRSNQLGATVPDPARVAGPGDGSVFPHARGEAEAAPDCGTVGGAAMGACSVGAQAARTWSPDDHGGCGERVCQSAAESPSCADAWPKAARRLANGGLPNGELSPAGPPVGGPTAGDATVGDATGGVVTGGVVTEGAATVAATADACAAAAASNAAVAGPGTFFGWIGC